VIVEHALDGTHISNRLCHIVELTTRPRDEVEGAPRARSVSAVTRDLRTGLDELFAYFGMFPSSVTKTGPDGKPVTTIEPVSAGSDIRSGYVCGLR
jgi:hypothetical protein